MGYYDQTGAWVEGGQPPPDVMTGQTQAQTVNVATPATTQTQNPVPPMDVGTGQTINRPEGVDTTPQGNALPPAQEGTRPAPPPNMFIRTPGSPGGLTRVGQVASRALPAAAQGDLAAADAQARGVEAEGKGQGLAADAYKDALGREEDMKPWEETLAARKEKAKEDLFARRMQIAEEEKNDRIDGARIFSGEGGTWKRVLSALFVGLSGAPAMETIGRWIDRDIQLQQQQLGAKKQSRSTELGALASEVDRWGDAQAAQDKIKGDMWLSVAKQADMYAKSAANDKAKANAEAMRDQALANYNRTAVSMAEYMGSKVAYTPPSGGGVRINPAFVQHAQQQGYDPKALNERAAEYRRIPGMDQATAYALAYAQGPTDTYEVEAERKKQAAKPQDKVDPITHQVMEVGQRMQQEKIPEADAQINEIEAILAKTPEGEDPAGFGRFTSMASNVPVLRDAMRAGILSPEGVRNQQAILKAFSQWRNAVTGSAFSEAENRDYFYSFVGRGTREDLDNAVRRMRSETDAKRANVLASVNPKAAEVYRSQLGSQRTQQATGGFDFSPAGGK